MNAKTKQTIAGLLPADWEAALIKQRCQVVRGSSPRPAGDSRFFDGDFLPWITVADVTGPSGIYLTTTRSKLTREGAKHTRIVPPSTLVISNSGATLGVPKITTIEAGANDGVAMFLQPVGISNEFLYFVLESKTDYFRDELAPGVGQPNLNTELLGDVAIAIPPLLEQDRIANLLSAWNAAIDKAQQLISAKQTGNTEMANRLLFGVTRLGKHNSATAKAIHWFTAPADWQAVEIGDVAEEKSIQNGTQIGLPVLSCTKHDGLVDSLQYFNKQIFSHDTAKYRVVERGQFAYATNHIEEGSIGYQDFLPAGLVSPMYTVFQPDAERIDGRYFYKLLKSEKMRQIFAARTNASVDRRGSLRWKDFARIPIALPSLAEQRKISQLLDEAAHEVALLQREVAALKTQKRGLMQKLLTGQWRVPLSASEASEVRG
jgi:type I restriction enzyme, S subunit